MTWRRECKQQELVLDQSPGNVACMLGLLGEPAFWQEGDFHIIKNEPRPEITLFGLITLAKKVPCIFCKYWHGQYLLSCAVHRSSLTCPFSIGLHTLWEVLHIQWRQEQTTSDSPERDGQRVGDHVGHSARGVLAYLERNQ